MQSWEVRNLHVKVLVIVEGQVVFFVLVKTCLFVTLPSLHMPDFLYLTLISHLEQMPA